jgi:hypothetical protein
VKLLYREFSEDRTRPAFSQEVTSDLKEGTLVDFKGARIEILEATNISIRYKVKVPVTLIRCYWARIGT